MSIIEIILLGLLQGLTEFIPVSSSGHLVLAHELFGNTENSLVFDVALHVGTLLALILYFRKDIMRLLLNFLEKNKDGQMARILMVATVPAIVAGVLFEGLIDEYARTPLVVALMLALVGGLMLLAEKLARGKMPKPLTMKRGIAIGFAQSAALVPGVSRSGATITAGLFLGLSRLEAARFSFLLAIPIIAGSALGIFMRNPDSISGSGLELVLGAAVAFVSGLFAIKFLMGYLAKRSLAVFAWYRIGLAVLVLLATFAF